MQNPSSGNFSPRILSQKVPSWFVKTPVSSKNMSSNSEPNKGFESGTQIDHGTKHHFNHDKVRNNVTWADIVIGNNNKK